MSTTFIYVLKEPDTGEIRYVGKADDPERRLYGHLRDAKRETNHKSNWIRLLFGRGLEPVLEIVDEVLEEYWQQWEVAWMEFYRAEGCNLVNTNQGGEGGPSGRHRVHSLETRKKMSLARVGMRLSSEHKNNISAALIGRAGMACSLETKKKIGNANRNPSLETRKRLSAASSRRKDSSETRKKKSATARLSWEKRRQNAILEEMWL